MHFHLATLLLLAPLIAAAPTPNLDQGLPPADLTKEIAETAGQLTKPLGGDLPELPIGNARRQSSSVTDTIFEGLVDIATPPADSKREEPKGITETVASTLGELTGSVRGDLTKSPGTKRQSSGTLNSVITTLVEMSKPPADRKRQGTSSGPTDSLLAAVLALTKPPAERKRQSPDAAAEILADVLEEVAGAIEKTKDQSPEASRKRQSAEDPTAALVTILGLLTEAAGEAGAAKAKRLGIDVVAKETVVDPVISGATGST